MSFMKMYKGVLWEGKHPKATFSMLGLIPDFLKGDSSLSIAKQIDDNYMGGWLPAKDADEMVKFSDDFSIMDPETPHPYLLIAEAVIGSERIRVYTHAWVSITQADGSYEVAKVD